METISVTLKEEFILDKDAWQSPKLSVNNTETDDNLYFKANKDFSEVCIDCYASEELKTRFAEFCDGIYFLTEHYKSTNYQIPTKVLFSRGDDQMGLFLMLKTEFFEIEVM